MANDESMENTAIGQKALKVAIVHDWLINYRGGEKVLEAIAGLYPEAPIYTLFCDPKSLSSTLKRREIRYPQWTRYFLKVRKLMLPILPAMAEAIDLSEFDLILSTSSCVAKGVLVGPEAVHVCYMHSPMRYAWDQADLYFGRWYRFYPTRLLINFFLSFLRIWDVTSSVRVTRFIANSSFVQKRIERYYGKKSSVIHPPIAAIPESDAKIQDYFVVAGSFERYKRFDLAILACEKMKRRLIVCGAGPDEKRLRGLASKYTEFVIRPDDARLQSIIASAQAFLFPGVEDFGMIAVEAMSLKTPVIAYAKGGALDFVKEGVTGKFFYSQEVQALCNVMADFDRSKFSGKDLRVMAASFSNEAFSKKMKSVIESAVME